jgi:hypothetical protein
LIIIFISFTTAWWCALKQIEFLFCSLDMTNFSYNIHCQYYTNGKAIVLSFQKEIGKVYVIEGNKGYFILFVQLQRTHPIAISNKNGATNYNHLNLTCSLDWRIFFWKFARAIWIWVFGLKVLKFKPYYYCLILEYYNNY